MAGAGALEPQPGLRSSLLNGSYLALSKFYYLAVRGAYIVFFARIIGVEAYGYYSYTQNWYVLLLPLAMWGMNELVISELVKTPASQRPALLGSGLGLRIVLAIGFALLTMILAVIVEPDSGLRLLIFIYTQGLVARSIANWYSALFVAAGKSAYWLGVSVPFMTLEIVLALLLAYRGATLVDIAWMQCTLWWLMMFGAWLLYRSRIGSQPLAWSWAYLAFYFRQGASLGAATFLIYCLTPILLILYRSLAADVQRLGDVALVLQVIAILGQIVLVVSNAGLPALGRTGPGAADRLRKFCRLVWLGSFYAGGAVVVAVMVLVPLAVAAYPDSVFADPALLFARHCWLLAPMMAVHGIRLALISDGRVHGFLLVMVLGVAVLVALVFLLKFQGLLDTDSVFSALGVSFSVIALAMLCVLQRAGLGMPVPALLVPVLAFGAVLVLLVSVAPEQPWFAVFAAIAVLALARLAHRLTTAAAVGLV